MMIYQPKNCAILFLVMDCFVRIVGQSLLSATFGNQTLWDKATANVSSTPSHHFHQAKGNQTLWDNATANVSSPPSHYHFHQAKGNQTFWDNATAKFRSTPSHYFHQANGSLAEQPENALALALVNFEVEAREGCSKLQLYQELTKDECIEASSVLGVGNNHSTWDDSANVGRWFDRPEGCFFDDELNLAYYNEATFIHFDQHKRFSYAKDKNPTSLSHVCKVVIPKVNVSASYDFHQIAPQHVWYGQVLQFYIHRDNETLTSDLSIELLSTGNANNFENISVTWDAANGLFQFKPSLQDKFPFDVSLLNTLYNESTTFRITPMQILDPEVEIFASILDPSDVPVERKILCINGTVEFFNGENRQTKICQIVVDDGSLVLKTGKWPLHQVEIENIARLDLIAETIVVVDPIHLPRTNLTIFARNLLIVSENVHISTTPKTLLKTADEGENGIPGEDSGSISLYIDSISFPFNGVPSPVFITQGGDGQEQGQCQNGTDGRSNKPEPPIETYEGYDIIWRKRKQNYQCSADADDEIRGVQHWPEDGTDAKSSGIPGQGGNGGAFYSSVFLPPHLYLTSGGKSGEDRTNLGKYVCFGGAAGEPQVSAMKEDEYYFRCVNCELWWWCDTFDPPEVRNPRLIEFEGKTHVETKKGKDANNTEGFGADGLAGKLQVDASKSSSSWINPALLNKILIRVRSIFERGDYLAAKNLLSQYLSDLDLALASGSSLLQENHVDLMSARNEMTVMLSRIESGQDYYGNQGGWVPLLSYEVWGEAVHDEVDNALEVLYMVYWLSDKDRKCEEKREKVEALKNQLEAENDVLTDKYNDLVGRALPEITAKLERTTKRSQKAREELEQITQRLTREAEKEAERRNKVPWWKKTLKVVSAVTKVIPVYQPYLGTAGNLLDLATDIDYSDPDPLEISLGILDTYASHEQAKADDLTPSKLPKNASIHLERAEFAQKTSECVKEVSSQLSKPRISMSEVETVLQQLKSDSPEYREVMEEVQMLAKERGRLGAELAHISSELSNIPNVLAENALALDSMTSMSCFTVESTGRFDTYLARLQSSASTRLQKYLYFFGRAYCYRLLQDYTLSFDSRDFTRLLELANIDEDSKGTLTRDEILSLRAAFQEDFVRVIAEDILNQYNGRGANFEKETSETIELSPTELSKLNSNARDLVLNFMSRGTFRLDESNLRITDINVVEIETEETSGDGSLLFSFVHSGRSLIRDEGRMYMFHHSPIEWYTKYHLHNKVLEAIYTSDAGESLLMHTLELDYMNEDMQLFARPGAWADIAVKVSSNPPHVIIKKLVLELRYDAVLTTDSGPRILRTMPRISGDETMEVLPSYYEISAEDDNGRADGRGDTFRVYRKSQPLHVTAQAVIGESYVFDSWVSEDGKILSRNVTLNIYLDDHTTLVPLYRRADAPQPPPPKSPPSSESPELPLDSHERGLVFIPVFLFVLVFLILLVLILCRWFKKDTGLFKKAFRTDDSDNSTMTTTSDAGRDVIVPAKNVIWRDKKGRARYKIPYQVSLTHCRVVSASSSDTWDNSSNMTGTVDDSGTSTGAGTAEDVIVDDLDFLENFEDIPIMEQAADMEGDGLSEKPITDRAADNLLNSLAFMEQSEADPSSSPASCAIM